jgi:2-polyprenyl-3-methyl-5-hydroxy-6-metoxy-1,4-benzoquinol methylase
MVADGHEKDSASNGLTFFFSIMDKLSLGTHPDFPFCTVVQDGDFCYTNPYPSNKQLTEYYNSTYRAVRHEAPTSDYVRFMGARAKVQAEFIRQGSGKNRFAGVLDIGSGCGTLLAELQNDADHLEGWEPDVTMSKHAIDLFANSKIKFTNDLFIPGKSEQKFDLITMSHVLEHVPHPGDFLAELRTHHLSEGGSIFIEVPNDPLVWVQKQIQWQLRGFAHLNFFTEQNLSSLFAACGFEIQALRLCGDDLPAQIRALRPLGYIRRALRKIQRIFKPDIQNFSILPNYLPTKNRSAAVYIQLLARRA